MMYYTSLEEITRDSDLIFEGRVISVESEWNNNPRHIFSTLRIRIHNIIEDNNSQKEIGDIIELRLPGGKVDGITMFVLGGPRFYMGENVLLFLKKEKKKFLLNGFTLGKFSIKTDKTGNKILERDLSGMDIVGMKQDDIFMQKEQNYNSIISRVKTAYMER